MPVRAYWLLISGEPRHVPVGGAPELTNTGNKFGVTAASRLLPVLPGTDPVRLDTKLGEGGGARTSSG